VPYRIAARDVVNPTSYAHMERGLEQTTDEPPASDEVRSLAVDLHASADAAGAVIGALGVDYSLDYVDDVQSQVQREMFPVLGAAYLFLLALVLVISSAVVRPLRRLTEATGRIAEGEYDLDVASITPTRFPDEMTQLARSFAVMAAKVAQRERTLTRQVQQVRIEIDAARKEESVRDIVESDFFADIAAKGAQMRRRRDEDS
jgi:HAMP domain-containing protein